MNKKGIIDIFTHMKAPANICIIHVIILMTLKINLK